MFAFLANACCARPEDKDAQDPLGPPKPAPMLAGADDDDDDDGGSAASKPIRAMSPRGGASKDRVPGIGGHEVVDNRMHKLPDAKDALASSFVPRKPEVAASDAAAGQPANVKNPFPEGSDVVVKGGKNDGKKGKVCAFKVNDEKEKEWKVELEAGGTTWTKTLVSWDEWNSAAAGDTIEWDHADGTRKQGVVLKFTGQGAGRRYQVTMADGKNTWVDAEKSNAKKVSGAAPAAEAAPAPLYSDVNDMPKVGDTIYCIAEGSKFVGQKGKVLQARGSDVDSREWKVQFGEGDKAVVSWVRGVVFEKDWKE